MSGALVLALRLSMAAAVYTFLGMALWVIYQDLRRDAWNVSTARTPAIHLQIKNRHRIISFQTFTKSLIVLGRNPECDVRLDDQTASAHHAKLSYHHSQWWVEDLDSTNGTKLNKVKLTIPTVLTSDDEIQCGKIKITFTLNDNSADSLRRK